MYIHMYLRCYEKGYGSDLVSIHSQAENEFIASLQPEVIYSNIYRVSPKKDYKERLDGIFQNCFYILKLVVYYHVI